MAQFSLKNYFSQRKKMMIYLITGFMAAILLGSAGIYFYIYSGLQSVDIDEEIEIEIPRGSNLRQVADILEDNGIIRDATLFRYYARFSGYDAQLQAGEYLFEDEIAPEEVLIKLAQGDVIDRSIRFTIPEGLRADQVAQRLESQGLGDKDKFLELFSEPEEWDYWFLEGLAEEHVKFPLEGFLYPDTYQVQEDISEEEVVKRMLDQFNEVFDESYQEKKEHQGFNIHELITIASIVEREAVIDDERGKVAGVFLNRLENNMRLEACATVEYVLQENKPVLSDADTQIETPYNTYQNSGLPPGPIASPGRASIEAALDPKEHDYLFFVAKHDGSRTHVFSETYQEHLQAKERVRAD
ncbi:endolytic transglycosylase MltG [Natranaerobius thermophilus]|uniref:Endolytic murein transglycosylase n=1 Tax=Natranaerobius thermophilus (strain ATCC BAA-1301 / DSM 18059 / JW/NM-WN-LF) TaxID=457570 RepID=B2A5J3_NATTJ|nr:endolytic transglycosylase MltG [Natranaerobius thermophilus]ACB85348.1 aminodeoxychorismate lyase [Natranaerobius thermophilus JW/NM-WN-LF]